MAMSTLTFTPQSSECPPEDTYILELVTIGEFESRANTFAEGEVNIQSKWTFRVVDFEYDPDVDEQDWNGTTVSAFLVFYRDKENGSRAESWKSEKSTAFKFLTAFLGHKPEDGEDIDLESFIGKRIKATVAPNEKGYARISAPLAHKSRKKKAAAPVEDEDDEVNPYKMTA